jgi:hypothetical protein
MVRHERFVILAAMVDGQIVTAATAEQPHKAQRIGDSEGFCGRHSPHGGLHSCRR